MVQQPLLWHISTASVHLLMHVSCLHAYAAHMPQPPLTLLTVSACSLRLLCYSQLNDITPKLNALVTQRAKIGAQLNENEMVKKVKQIEHSTMGT